ncbi:unnamed protein product, partial [Amoebophrya sp. A120]
VGGALPCFLGFGAPRLLCCVHGVGKLSAGALGAVRSAVSSPGAGNSRRLPVAPRGGSMCFPQQVLKRRRARPK